MRAFAGLVVLFVLLSPRVAAALPQFSVLSARQCDNCHVEPYDWPNPELSERKCSLSCTTCHVNPTGGGMRSTAGTFYGREILAMFGPRPSDAVGAEATGDRPASRPADGRAAAPPGSAERYAGMTAKPFVQVGTDVRLLGYFPQNADDAFFPMQADLYLLARPYNPEELNRGRLTLLVNGGFLGSRAEEFDAFYERAFLREWWVLFDDLPYQLYGKAGQFLPAFGWRLADHTAFIRQGQSFTNERQVTGLEVGLNPNYLYAHASAYVPGPLATRGRTGAERFTVLDVDNGFGTALSAGWRDLWWQAGGSFMFESRDDRTDLWIGANWALNLHEARHPWSKTNLAPITYLGEYDLRYTSTDAAGGVVGLTAFHELDVLVVEGLFLQLRYDWQDPDVSVADNHRHRYTAGVMIHPVMHVEIYAQIRFNDEPAKVFDNEALLQLHLWY